MFSQIRVNVLKSAEQHSRVPRATNDTTARLHSATQRKMLTANTESVRPFDFATPSQQKHWEIHRKQSFRKCRAGISG